MSEPEPRNPARRRAGLALRLSLGAIVIWLVFRNTDWGSVSGAVRTADPRFLLVALGSAFCAQLARVQRAVPVVRAATAAPYGAIFRPAQIGLLVNLALPLRLGDATRAFVMSRALQVPLARSFTLVALDRLSDLVGLLVLVGVALAMLPTGPALELSPGLVPGLESQVVAADLLARFAVFGGVAVSGIGLALALLYARAPWLERFADVLARPFPAAARERLRGAISDVAEGLELLRSPAALLGSLGFALLAWGLGVFTMTAVMTAFDLPFAWRTPLLMQASVAAFILVPLAPGLVGQFHLPIVLCLSMTLPGLPASEAMAVAVAIHGISVAPILVLGGYSLARERLGWHQLVQRAGRR